MHIHAWIQKVLSEGVQRFLFVCVLVDEGKEDPNTTICGPSPALQPNTLWSPSGRGWPLGSLVCGVFLCFVTFSFGVPDRIWCFVVSTLTFAFFFTKNNKLFV